MVVFLLTFVLFQQVNPTGTVTGVVRNAAGMPAAGVRVYAISAAEPKDAGNVTPALEGLSQTDSAGRFRLEVPAGRYFIAAGSVESPTYAPGTPDLKNARLVSITSAAVVDNVDVSGYVPAIRAPSDQFSIRPIPGATGVLSGVIQYADGTPAAGLFVSATPASIVNALPAGIQNAQQATDIARAQLAQKLASLPGSSFNGLARGGQTDSNGRYRLDNLAPDTYYIAAGWADSPTLYPGVTDIASASTLTTTPTTRLDTLNFTIPQPPIGTTVSGRILAIGGSPAEGASVQLRLNSLGPVSGLLPGRPFQRADSKSDGSFEIHRVAPGTYVLEARMPDASPISRNIVVANRPVADLEFSFPVTSVRGRILWEDGTPFSDVQSIGEVGLVTGTLPNVVLTTLFPLDGSGTFGRTMAEGDYRFFLRTLPDDYAIRSITSGSVDLLKEMLKITPSAPIDIEVRLAKRMNPAGTRVQGRVLDGITGKPAVAEGVLLCCRENGPIYRIATRVREDGSFEFAGITPGVYTAQLRSRATPSLVDHAIAVGDADVSGITLFAAADLVPVTTRIAADDGNLAAASGVTITFTGTSEVTQIVVVASANTGQAMAWVPAGDSYTVTVSNIPDAYILKAIGGGDGMLMTGGRLNVVKGTIPNVMVTLDKR